MTPLQRAAKQVGEIQKILLTEEITLGKRRYLESELFVLCENIAGEEMLETATVFENQMYVRQHSPVFDTVRFFTNDNSDVLKMLYYNPDSDDGGQMVQNDLHIGMLQEALKECDEEQFWERLDEQAKQYLTDIDSPDFAEEARFFVEAPYDFCGQDSNTLAQIEAWVEASLSLEEDPAPDITM